MTFGAKELIKDTLKSLISSSSSTGRLLMFRDVLEKRLQQPGGSLRVYRYWLPTLPQKMPTDQEVSSMISKFPSYFASYQHLLNTYTVPELSDISSMSGSTEDEAKEMCILGNVFATNQMVEEATMTFEQCLRTSSSSGGERNSLFSLAQIVQYASILDNGGMAEYEWTTFSCQVGACALYERASAMGHAQATFNLSLLTQQIAMSSTGGAKKSFAEYSFEMMKKAACEMEFPQAYSAYAQLLISSDRPQESKEESQEFLMKAARLNDVSAKILLGSNAAKSGNIIKAALIWHDGSRSELDLDKWPMNLRSIADCFYRIGCLYFLGVHPNDETYQRLSQYQDLYSSPMSMEENEGGVIGKPNYLLAQEYWTMASEVDESHSLSQLCLGNLHLDALVGGNRKTDFEKASFHYERALSSLTTPDHYDSQPHSEEVEDFKSVLEGLLDICNEKLLNPKEEVPRSRSRRSLQIRLFTPRDQLSEEEKFFANNAVQVDDEHRKLHNAQAGRWKFIERVLN